MTAAEAAPIAVRKAGVARPLGPTFFGVNGNNIRSSLKWDRSDVSGALTSLRPGIIRYPAGTIGNYWDWRAGWFQPNGPWEGQTVNGVVITPFDNRLPPYATALTRCGAGAVFMLNMLTIDGRLASAADSQRMLQDQIQFLQAAASLGIDVTRIELGNEFYLSAANAPDYSVRFPTAASYAQEANTWTVALQAQFPNAQIAAVATNATNVNSARRENWNAGVLPGMPAVEAVTMHPYIYINPADASATPQAQLSRPYAMVQTLVAEDFQQLAAHGVTAWMTEFNMIDKSTDRRFAGTWMHGLAVTAYALLLAQKPIVGMMQLHNVFGDALAGALFDTTAGFGSPTPSTQFLGRSAVGVTYASLFQATATSTNGQQLSFPGGPALAAGGPGLVGMDFSNGSVHQAVVVNLAPSAVTLDITSLFSGTVRWSRTTAASLTTRITGTGSVTTTSGTATGTLNVPRHSVTRIFR
jgi:hypothetical protein